MKNLNRILLMLVICYFVFTAVVHYYIIRETAPLYGGRWKLVWTDDFNGSTLDQSKWTVVNQGSSPNNELQAYADKNVIVKGGYLILTAKREEWNGSNNSHPGRKLTRHFTSGQVETNDKYTWTYGRFEIKAKFPKGSGLLSSASLRTVSWPPEIEIMQIRGYDPHLVVMNNFWGPNYLYFRCDSSGPAFGTDYSESFHIYTLEWEPEILRWYIDGVVMFQLSRHVPYRPLFLNMKTVVGGLYAGSPDITGQGQTAWESRDYIIDWVRIYQRKKKVCK